MCVCACLVFRPAEQPLTDTLKVKAGSHRTFQSQNDPMCEGPCLRQF